MLLTEAIPFLLIVATATIGVFSYAAQKQRDRKEELIKIRRAEYRKWIESFHQVIETGTEESLGKFNTATNDLFVIGSDSVIRSVGAFKNYMAETSPGGTERDVAHAGLLWARLIKEMRRDCFEATSLKEDEIVRILPFSGM